MWASIVAYTNHAIGSSQHTKKKKHTRCKWLLLLFFDMHTIQHQRLIYCERAIFYAFFHSLVFVVSFFIYFKKKISFYIPLATDASLVHHFFSIPFFTVRFEVLHFYKMFISSNALHYTFPQWVLVPREANNFASQQFFFLFYFHVCERFCLLFGRSLLLMTINEQIFFSHLKRCSALAVGWIYVARLLLLILQNYNM